jgi:hypothetical protein
MWGRQDFNSKFIWPFSQYTLAMNVTDYSGTEYYTSAKCVDEDTYYDRGSLLDGFPCINNLECRSKVCSSGYCKGTSLGGYCSENKDCKSGLSC